jgi:outer membrane protein insertion porin family/translocation and assembly module TamA
MRRLGFVRGLLAAALAAGSIACHEEGQVDVASLSFSGNSAVRSSELEAILATRAGGWLPWGEKPSFDRQEFENDLGRIRRFYQDRGYPDARVADVDVELNERGTAVDLTVHIDEGAPLVVEAVEFQGFDVLEGAARDRVQDISVPTGGPRDRATIAAARQQALDLLRNNGYAYAEVKTDERRQGAGVVVTIAADPGPPTTFGEISVVGLQELDESVVRRQLSFRPGQIYRDSQVVQSQRRLSSLEILRFANIDARPAGDSQPPAVPVVVTVAEAPPRRLQLGAGYGSEDQLRGSIEWSHLNFLGNARQLTTTAKWSSLDRGTRAALVQPYLFARGISLDASASTWWTSEETYESHTFGGRVGLGYRMRRGERGSRRMPGDLLRVAYVHEYLRYNIRPEALEDLTTFDQLIALGLDPVTGRGSGTRAAVTFDYERDRTDNLADPRSGYGLSLHLEEARPWLGGGTFSYREVLAQGRAYLPMGPAVLAGRARTGTILAASDTDVPFSQRYFLGGSSSLRGWGRYQVAPLADGLAVGGRTIVDVSAGIRFPVRGRLGGVVFVDAGNVWAGSLAATTSGLRSDAGFGVRFGTPVGLIRADLGYQLNPIEGLIVNGEPESRRWRVHFSIGQSF